MMLDHDQVEIPSTEIYLKVLEAFKLANHKTIT